MVSMGVSQQTYLPRWRRNECGCRDNKGMGKGTYLSSPPFILGWPPRRYSAMYSLSLFPEVSRGMAGRAVSGKKQGGESVVTDVPVEQSRRCLKYPSQTAIKRC